MNLVCAVILVLTREYFFFSNKMRENTVSFGTTVVKILFPPLFAYSLCSFFTGVVEKPLFFFPKSRDFLLASPLSLGAWVAEMKLT